jgi:DNA-binding SARP family transcriptional activator/predicted ATPase
VTLIRIELLGKFRLTFGQQLVTSVNTNRMRSLLAFLVLHGEAAQSRERLASLLWPESGEAQARTNLRQLLHNLRRALPVECSLLVSDNQTVRWLPDCSCMIDVVEFEAAIRAAEAVRDTNASGTREMLEKAAQLYQDDLLPDLYDDWLQSRRQQLRKLFAEVLSRLSALLEAAGEIVGAIRHVERLVALDPLRETYYQSLIHLHVLNQDRSSALRVYHQCKRNLQRDLGVSPGRETQDVFMQALKSEGPSSAPAELPPIAAPRLQPMVGRKLEWERLLGCWRRATESGPHEPHLALIIGEPGVGKSRLAEEMFQTCSRNPNWAAARARCYFAQGQLAYGPVAEWLREEPLRRARVKLPKPQLAELARVLPELLVDNPALAPPQPLTESWQRLHLYEALNAAFRNAAKPLLLLIDDLQWCDQDSFEWLHSLFRSGAADRVLFLGTVRMEETGRDHLLANLMRELDKSGQLSQVPLGPFSVEETATLAAQVATRTCDPSFVSGLYQTTKGNALFVVESVRAALEGDGAKNAVPPRVQAVISSRLAQLSSAAYELAGLAAAIGRPFSFELLVKGTDWDEDSISRCLEELWQRRIIDGVGGDTYQFTHDLLRDVTYVELSPIRRRLLHRRIARSLEELNANDLEGVSGWVAAHYDSAGMAEEAIRNCKIAASVAKRRFADAEAADLIRRALRLCRDLPESAKRDQQELDLLVTLGALVTTHGYTMQEVGDTYARGLVLSKRAGDRKHLFPLLSGAWLFHIVRGELQESRRVAQDSVDAAQLENAFAQQMASQFLLGTSLFHLGQFEASWQQIEQAVPAADGPMHPALALFAGPDVGVFRRAYLSHLLCLFGKVAEAEELSVESIVKARAVSHPFTLGIALDYAAMLQVYRGDGKRALALAEEASDVCGKHGFVYYQGLADIFAGWATGAEGNTGPGLARLRKGLDAVKGLRAELRLPFYHGLLAEICGLAGHASEALANIASGLAFLNKNGETWSAPELHRIHGDLLRRSGDGEQAKTSYHHAIDLARRSGARLFEQRAEAGLSGLFALLNGQGNAAER